MNFLVVVNLSRFLISSDMLLLCSNVYLRHDIHQFYIGDGDSRHIGFKVPLPDAFEITSVSIFSVTFGF